eukprot:Sspe_Gene.15674::Locus_5463_Transcript_1_1_Confidence_1.000_Length_1366::g.15674::m.15674
MHDDLCSMCESETWSLECEECGLLRFCDPCCTELHALQALREHRVVRRGTGESFVPRNYVSPPPPRFPPGSSRGGSPPASQSSSSTPAFAPSSPCSTPDTPKASPMLSVPTVVLAKQSPNMHPVETRCSEIPQVCKAIAREARGKRAAAEETEARVVAKRDAVCASAEAARGAITAQFAALRRLLGQREDALLRRVAEAERRHTASASSLLDELSTVIREFATLSEESHRSDMGLEMRLAEATQRHEGVKSKLAALGDDDVEMPRVSTRQAEDALSLLGSAMSSPPKPPGWTVLTPAPGDTPADVERRFDPTLRPSQRLYSPPPSARATERTASFGAPFRNSPLRRNDLLGRPSSPSKASRATESYASIHKRDARGRRGSIDSSDHRLSKPSSPAKSRPSFVTSPRASMVNVPFR